jgi:excisionase family DNA binding protein
MGTKKRTKTTEITVGRSEVFVVRKPKKLVFAWCDACGARVRMLTPEEAATVSGVSTRTVYRRVEAGQIHFAETPEGTLLICLNSTA